MWKLDASGRVAQWRAFRKELDAQSLDQALESIANFWQGCPFIPYNLDPEHPETWPDPWSLIYENAYCDVAKCLGIVYTLLLSAHGQDTDIEIRTYRDQNTGHSYNLAWIDQGKYILNMIDNTVVNKKHINKTLELVRTYTAADLQLENYI